MSETHSPPESFIRHSGSGSVYAVIALIALFVTGCPPKTEKSAPPAKCTAFGQSCEYSPGKLGSCVRRDDCTGNDCFVCQSQH